MEKNVENINNNLGGAFSKAPRSSNLELYRIVCMLMIVAHHYVVNSGVRAADGPMVTDPTAVNSIFLYLFGAWGKPGINCFLMITGLPHAPNKYRNILFTAVFVWSMG